MYTVHDLSDTDLMCCFDAYGVYPNIRQILDKKGVIHSSNGLINIEEFAERFAGDLEEFIEGKFGGEDWFAAWANNYDWGLDVADDINCYFENTYRYNTQ